MSRLGAFIAGFAWGATMISAPSSFLPREAAQQAQGGIYVEPRKAHAPRELFAVPEPPPPPPPARSFSQVLSDVLGGQ